MENLYIWFPISFRPLMGIILFNNKTRTGLKATNLVDGFRPLMGIILFNSLINTTKQYLNASEFPSPNGDYFI